MITPRIVCEGLDHQGEIPRPEGEILANYDTIMTARSLSATLTVHLSRAMGFLHGRGCHHDGRIDASDVLAQLGRRHGQRRQRLCR